MNEYSIISLKDENWLEGTIPTELSKLSKLQMLNIGETFKILASSVLFQNFLSHR